MAKKFSAATSKVTADFTDPTIVYLMGVENGGTPASFKATAFDVVRTGLTVAWSGIGTATTPLLVNVTADPGPANAASKLLDLQVLGVPVASINKLGTLTVAQVNAPYVVPSTSLNIKNNSGFLYFGSLDDLAVTRDAADTLAQRRGTTAQKQSVYNTYTDASNYERFVIDWKGTTNVARIGTEHAGTGVARAVSIVTGGVERIGIGATGVVSVVQTLALPAGASSANQYAFWANSNTGQFSFGSSLDAAINRPAAGILGITNGSTGGGALEFTKMTAPATPAADKARIFARDNGSGKTQVCIILPDGVVTVLATQT